MRFGLIINILCAFNQLLILAQFVTNYHEPYLASIFITYIFLKPKLMDDIFEDS